MIIACRLASTRVGRSEPTSDRSTKSGPGKCSDAFFTNQLEAMIPVSLIGKITGGIAEHESLYAFGDIGTQPLSYHSPPWTARTS